MRGRARRVIAGTMPPKIYYLQPQLLGPIENWAFHLDRCGDMGFDHVCLAPPFRPGPTGDIFFVADHDRLHPSFGSDDDAAAVITHVADLCAKAQLSLLLDLIVDRVAADHPLVAANRIWFRALRPEGDHLPDPRIPEPDRKGAYARFEEESVLSGVVEWWVDRIEHWTELGVGGFRCLFPEQVPARIWRRLAAITGARLFAWTPGLTRPDVSKLVGAGFAGTFGSTAWWDSRSPWLIDEYETLREVAPVLSVVEAPFAPRLAARLGASADLQAAYRHKLDVAASIGSGLLVPMGFDYALRRPLDRSQADPDTFARERTDAPLDLKDAIRRANATVDALAEQDAGGEMRLLTPAASPVTALLRADAADIREAKSAVVVLINPDLAHGHAPDIGFEPLPPSAGAAFAGAETVLSPDDPVSPLRPGEVRVVKTTCAAPIKRRAPGNRQAAAEAAKMPRIVVDRIAPGVDGGRFAAKRVVGDVVEVSADIFADGHEVLAAEVQWKAIDEADWRRAPLKLTVNDRWLGQLSLTRIGRYEIAVEAWWDVFGSYRHELLAKRRAGLNLTVELEEGRLLVESAARRAEGEVQGTLRTLLTQLADAADDRKAELLLTDEVMQAMAEADDRPFRVRSEPLPIDVERPQAAFASWYEMFPRSATDSASRHGTFADVIERLPEIRAMGFDVLYFPPIHPIGRTNRKGKNNSLKAGPDEVGSPYAIGSDEGGHDAIHSQLGTLDDFRRLVKAAHAHGLEIALDFAIQCSPDHPWLKEHPGWFRHRPDGTIKFAENPPKKYEDIVNVDFYAEDAVPDLWIALRDVVMHWCEEGVRTFRVDNPHTKPLPFWEWMMAEVRARFPDALFLSEAFTRPKMMYRLAKIGFSQSYTYFTWRNTKSELTEYLTELSTTEVKDYFRPHFFVNTPDINPVFLQTSGRGGFLIRAALAATMSGLWGLYSGFELCEAAPLPGKEEYLDSEKYEIRIRDRNQPGNIIAEVTALNRIRKAHPALQTHLGIRFYPAGNDQILIYSKSLRPPRDLVLIAVSLDPHHLQETTFELPLWEWGLPDHGSVAVEDLMRGHRFTWTGRIQRVRLDPSDLPFAIWRLEPGEPR